MNSGPGMRLRLTPLLFGLCGSCGEGPTPPQHPSGATCPAAGSCLIVTGLQFGRTAVIDPERETLLGQMGPTLDLTPPATLTFDSAKFLYAGYEVDSYSIAAVDVRNGSVQWGFRYPPGSPGDVQFVAPRFVAVANDEASVYVASVYRGGRPLVARLSRMGAYAGISEVSADTRLSVLRGLGPNGAGSLLFAGRSADRGAPTLFVVSNDLQVRDSVILPESPVADVWDALVSPDERIAYVNLRHRIYAIDLASGAVIHSRDSQKGLLSIRPDGSHLYVSDPGTFDEFASGIVNEYSADLSARRDLSLVDPASPDPPTHVRQIAVSRDGQTAYILSGTAELSAAGLERGSVGVLDLATGTMRKRIPLGEYLRGAAMFLFEPTPP